MCEICFQIHTDECGCSLTQWHWLVILCWQKPDVDVQSKYWPSETDTRYTNRWDVLAAKAGFLLGGRGDGGVTGGVTRWAGLLRQNLGKVTGHTSAVWPARATTWQTVRWRTRTLCSCQHKSKINILLYIYIWFLRRCFTRSDVLWYILIDGWLLVSCSSSSSSMQGLIRGLSPSNRLWVLYICRFKGPSSVDEEGPPDTGGPLTGAFTAARLNGFEWSKSETAMEALVLAPVTEERVKSSYRIICCLFLIKILF